MILNRIWTQTIIKRKILHLPDYRGMNAYWEHLSIYHALKLKDGKLAADLIKKHLEKGRKFVISDIELRQKEAFTKSL